MGRFRILRRWRRRSETYRVKDFRRREPLRPDYRLVAGSLLRHLAFDSVLDVGCGNGFLLAEFREAGKEVRGIEPSPAVRRVLPPPLQAAVEVGDFARAAGLWDLVCCVEVAEHIPPRRSEELVRTVTRSARRWIYFTAAQEGQGGHGHINCRPHGEWLAWFARRGWEVVPEATTGVRRDLESLAIAVWLRGNSFVLRPAAGRP